MPEDVPPPSHTGGKGVKGFLSQETAGLPNWAWILVVAGGIAAAYFLPKLFGQSTATTTDTTAANPATTDQSGLLTVPQGQIPVLPPGVNPTYSPAGNLTAYSVQGPTATSTPQNPTYQSAFTRGTAGGQGDIPIWGNTNVDWANRVTSIRPNTPVQIGQAVTGTSGNQSAIFFPISYNGQNGYVGSWDLAALQPTVTATQPLWPGGTQQQRVG